MAMNTAIKTVDEYIAPFPPSTRSLLEEMRSIIQKAAPGVKEKISYGIPTFYYEKNLVHFGGYKTHIGFYPGAGAIKHFAEELAAFPLSKGTVQFSLDKKIPAALVRKIVKYRVKMSREE